MLRLMTVVCALNLLPSGDAGAQTFECFDPVAFELHQLTVVNGGGEGAVLEIEAFNTFDGNVGGLIRYPSRGTMLRLDADGTRRLDPPFKVYVRFQTKVKATLITIPAYADDETLNFIASVANELISTAADFAFKEQPLLSAISSSLAATLSSVVLDTLREGSISASEPTEIKSLTLFPFIQADGFSVTARPICEKLFNAN